MSKYYAYINNRGTIKNTHQAGRGGSVFRRLRQEDYNFKARRAWTMQWNPASKTPKKSQTWWHRLIILALGN
jgi:hypothetical protein